MVRLDSIKKKSTKYYYQTPKHTYDSFSLSPSVSHHTHALRSGLGDERM